MATLHTNGIGGSTGPGLVTASPLYGGTIYYVHHSGSDSNNGTERSRPLATVDAATSTASAVGSIVCLLEGHREELSGTSPTVAAGVTLIGEGEGDSRPKIWSPEDLTTLVVLAGARAENIWIGESIAKNSGAAPSATRLQCATGVDLEGVRVDIGDLNTTHAVTLVAGNSNAVQRLTNVAINVDRSTTVFGYLAIQCSTGYVIMDEVTIDGGEQGFNAAAIGRITDTTPTAVRMTNMRLLNGADISLVASGTGTTAYGYVHVVESSGNSKVLW